MKKEAGFHDYNTLKSIEQKRLIGNQFASAAAFEPQIRELLKLDKMPALRYLAICRLMLFDSIHPHLIKTKGKKKSHLPFSNHDLIKEVNLNTAPFRELKITPKNEEAFYELVNTINRMSILFYYEELIPKNKKKLFLQEMKKLGEGLEFVFGSSDQKISAEFDRFVEFSKDIELEEQIQIKDVIETNVEDETTLDEELKEESLKGKEENKNDQLLDRKQMIDLFKITYPTLHTHIKRGIIPKPFYVGSKPRWQRSEIMDYLESLGDKN